MDRVTFDFERSQVTFETEGQQGTEYVEGLRDRKAAIMAAAGYDMIPAGDLLDEIRGLLNT